MSSHLFFIRRQGNVAVDVARMLVLTKEKLSVTDTTCAALDRLVGSGVKVVHLVGRRGPAQASCFTYWNRERMRGPGHFFYYNLFCLRVVYHFVCMYVVCYVLIVCMLFVIYS